MRVCLGGVGAWWASAPACRGCSVARVSVPVAGGRVCFGVLIGSWSVVQAVSTGVSELDAASALLEVELASTQAAVKDVSTLKSKAERNALVQVCAPYPPPPSPVMTCVDCMLGRVGGGGVCVAFSDAVRVRVGWWWCHRNWPKPSRPS